MFIRKILGFILVLAFVLLTIPNFILYGVSRTYLNEEFYQRDEIVSKSYDFVINKTVNILRKNSSMFSGYFSEDILRNEVKNVYTKEIFSETLFNFVDQLIAIKNGKSNTIKIDLNSLKQNLLTVANILTYRIYQELPTCSDSGLSDVLSSIEPPQCIIANIPYDRMIRPISENFNATVYNNIPDELSGLEGLIPVGFLVKIDFYKNLLFIFLIVIIALIALTVSDKLTIIVSFISQGFLFGGILGVIFSTLMFSQLGFVINAQIGDEITMKLFEFLIGFLQDEIQRMSILFILVGMILWLIKFILNRTIENKVVMKLD